MSLNHYTFLETKNSNSEQLLEHKNNIFFKEVWSVVKLTVEGKFYTCELKTNSAYIVYLLLVVWENILINNDKNIVL